MRSTLRMAAMAVASLCIVSCASQSNAPQAASCCAVPAASVEPASLASVGAAGASTLRIPDVPLVDHRGRPVRFYSDLVRGKVVAMSFFFTSCGTVCPPLTINMAKVQRLLGDRAGKEVQLISVSVDPVVDTPERLKAWAERFEAGPGWTFLTGKKQDVDELLKALSVFTVVKEEHTPFVLIGDEAAGRWKRAYGLSAPAKILAAIEEIAPPSTASADATQPAVQPPSFITAEATVSPASSKALQYFTDVELLDQQGETRRFYSDLLRDKIVVIDCFFTECTSVCPMLSSKLQKIQERYKDRMGKDLHLISLSVDCANDTPDKLRQYAARLGAREGWYFLTGKKENVDVALRKLGLYVESRDAHSTVLLIGNDKTGLWKKAMGLARDADVLRVVESVLGDAVP